MWAGVGGVGGENSPNAMAAPRVEKGAGREGSTRYGHRQVLDFLICRRESFPLPRLFFPAHEIANIFPKSSQKLKMGKK